MNSELSLVITYTLFILLISIFVWLFVGYILYKRWNYKNRPWIVGTILVGLIIFLLQKKKNVLTLLNTAIPFLGAVVAILKFSSLISRKIHKPENEAKKDVIIEGEIQK